MIKKPYIIINSLTRKAYAQRDTFAEALEVATRKINGLIVTRKDWENMKEVATKC